MKDNIKNLLLMLCIGLSANLNANPTINRALSNYIPSQVTNQNPYSLMGAATEWANALVQQLTTAERVALAYHCLNLRDNPNANDTTPEPIERILKQIAYGGVPVNEGYTRALAKRWNLTSELPWSWTSASDIPLVGGVVALGKGIAKATTAVQYTQQLYWTNLDEYIEDNSDNILTNGYMNRQFIAGFINAAQKDLGSNEFKQNATTYFNGNVKWINIKEDLITKLLDTISAAYESAGLELPGNFDKEIHTIINTNNDKLYKAFYGSRQGQPIQRQQPVQGQFRQGQSQRQIAPVQQQGQFRQGQGQRQIAPVQQQGQFRQGQPIQRQQQVQGQFRQNQPVQRQQVQRQLSPQAQKDFNFVQEALNMLHQKQIQWDKDDLNYLNALRTQTSRNQPLEQIQKNDLAQVMRKYQSQTSQQSQPLAVTAGQQPQQQGLRRTGSFDINAYLADPTHDVRRIDAWFDDFMQQARGRIDKATAMQAILNKIPSIPGLTPGYINIYNDTTRKLFETKWK